MRYNIDKKTGKKIFKKLYSPKDPPKKKPGVPRFKKPKKS